MEESSAGPPAQAVERMHCRICLCLEEDGDEGDTFIRPCKCKVYLYHIIASWCDLAPVERPGESCQCAPRVPEKVGQIEAIQLECGSVSVRGERLYSLHAYMLIPTVTSHFNVCDTPWWRQICGCEFLTTRRVRFIPLFKRLRCLISSSHIDHQQMAAHMHFSIVRKSSPRMFIFLGCHFLYLFFILQVLPSMPPASATH